MQNGITLKSNNNFYLAQTFEGNMSLRDNSRDSKLLDVILFILLFLFLFFASYIIVPAQTWNKFAEGTISFNSIDVTNLYSWGDSTYIMYDSISYNPHITKMIPGQPWRRWGGYYSGGNDIMFTLGGGIGKLGNNIVAIGGATANAVNGVSYNSYKYGWDGTTTNIAHSTSSGRGWATFRPNADSAYFFDGVLNVAKTADGITGTQLESGKTFRQVVNSSAGDYGQSMFFYSDTLWIGLARNSFTEASSNPVADTGRVIYYVPAKGKYYCLDRTVTNDGSVLSIKWMTMYKGALHVLVHSAGDKKGLWKWNGSDFIHVDTPFDSTANVYMAGMAGDNDKRLYISAGKYGVMDTTWNRIWELRDWTWKKLNKVYSYTAGKTDSVIVSPILHFNPNNNTLFAITPFVNSAPYLRVETHSTNQHKYYDAGSPAIWYTNVGALESIDLTNPVGGETFNANSSTTIEWTSNGIDEFKVYYASSGNNWSLLTTTASNSYSWTVPENNTSSAKIKVTNTDNTVGDSSSSFVIRYSFTLTEPTGGETYNGYDTVVVAWTDYGVDTAKVYFAINGTDYTLLTTTTNNTYSWAVPSIATVTAKIKITDIANAINDESNAFTITKVYLRTCFIKPN